MDPLKNQTTAVRAGDARRWWVLATMVAAQFIYGCDAFIVNVAIPTIARELAASEAQIEAVVAVYFIGYATLVITGGRLGDIFGTRNVFVAGVLGFALTSLWCGLARSGTELVVARLAQGSSAALMVPQVLATIHVLFNDDARPRAFGIYGIVLGLAGASGFAVGGLLLHYDPVGIGWRGVFVLNVPIGFAIAAAAWWLVPSMRRNPGARLDSVGALMMFLALLGLIGPLLFGRDLDWSPWIWLATAAGAAIIAIFLAHERRLAARGGMPLIDLALLRNAVFVRGLGAVFCFFLTNLSFYLAMTLYAQNALQISPLGTGAIFLPAAFAFVVAAQHSASRAARRGTLVLIEGCGVQVAGLTALALSVVAVSAPPTWLLALGLTIFGYGQGLVMAQLSSAVLVSVAPEAAGAAAGVYATVTQGANAVGVAAVGAIYFAVRTAASATNALIASLAAISLAAIACALLLGRMRRVAMRSGVNSPEKVSSNH
jgi:MFS family permease